MSIALLRNGRPVLGVVYAYSAPDDKGDLFTWAEGSEGLERNGHRVVPPLDEPRAMDGTLLVSQHADQNSLANATLAAPMRFRAVPTIAYRLALVASGEGHRRDDTGKENLSDCVLLIEGKGLSSGLDFAPEQAHAYAGHFSGCRVAAVLNGYCYKTYMRGGDGNFTTKPTAYANLLDPRDRYPLDPDHVDGTLALLKMLLPGSLR